METVVFELPSILPSFAGYCKGLVTQRSASGDDLRTSANSAAVSVADDAPVSLAGSAPVVSPIASRITCDGIVAQSGLSSPLFPYLSSLDTLHVSCWIDWQLNEFGMLLDYLQDYRLRLQEGDFGHVEEIALPFEQGMSFNLKRTGAGKYSYRLVSADVTILFSHHAPEAPTPNCRLEIGSLSCWSPGWKQIWEKFLTFIAFWKGNIVRQNIRRADFSADLLGCNFAETGFFDSNRWICKGSKKINSIEQEYVPSYKSFGKGDMMMRCYDKTMDLLRDSVKSDFFYKLWFDHTGYRPEYVTRVEFQVCRNVLKQFEVHTIDDLEQHLNSMWLYFTGSEDDGWARFCGESIPFEDRKAKNYRPYKVDALWQFVRSVRFSAALPEKLVRIHKKKPYFDFAKARRRVAGAMIAVCAAWGVPVHDYSLQDNRSFAFVYDALMEFRGQQLEEYIRRYEVKRNEMYQFGEAILQDGHDVIPTLMEVSSAT
jgi:hypothetical protein